MPASLKQMLSLSDAGNHAKRLLPGFGIATAAAGIFLGVFSDWPLALKLYATGGTYVLCCIASYVWMSMYGDEAFTTLSAHDLDGARLLLKPEDHLAWIGNRKVARYFGRGRIISFEEYRNWRRKNPLVFSCYVTEKHDLLGFFDIFPLTDSAGAALRSGELGETQITIDDILPEAETQAVSFVYIATIYSNYRDRVLQARLEQEAASLLLKLYPPRAGRFYIAIPYTQEGVNLLTRNGFILETNKHISASKTDVYVLDAEGAAKTLKRVLHKTVRLRKSLPASSIRRPPGRRSAREPLAHDPDIPPIARLSN